MRILLLAILIVVTVPLGGFAEDTVPGKAKHAEPIEVGSPAPKVSLKSVDGTPTTLHEALAGKPGVLVFYRGGWCPYCNRHLSALAKDEAAVTERGYRIFALSPDRPAELRKTLGEYNLTYTLLSDDTAEAAKAFGIAFTVDGVTRTLYKGYGINLEKSSGHDHHILPVPSVIVIDAEGTVRYVHSDPNYKERLAPGELIAALDALKPDAPKE